MSEKVLKLLVKDTNNSVEVLKYLDANISQIVKMGVRVKIELIKDSEFDESMVNALKARGIVRLPAMIMPDGSVFVGSKSIIELFDKNLRAMKTTQRVSAVRRPTVDTTDVTGYLMSQMFDGYDGDRSTKNFKPKLDTDDPDMGGGVPDFEKKMRSYEKSMPRHRKQDEDDDGPAHPPTRIRGMRNKFRDSDDSDDNIGDMDMPTPRSDRRAQTSRAQVKMPGRTPPPSSPDEMDRRMMDAWMDNNTKPDD